MMVMAALRKEGHHRSADGARPGRLVNRHAFQAGSPFSVAMAAKVRMQHDLGMVKECQGQEMNLRQLGLQPSDRGLGALSQVAQRIGVLSYLGTGVDDQLRTHLRISLLEGRALLPADGNVTR